MIGNQMSEQQQAIRDVLNAAKGQQKETPNVPKSILGLPYTVQNPQVWAKNDLYAQRDILRQQKKAAQEKGIQVKDVKTLNAEAEAEQSSGNPIIDAINEVTQKQPSRAYVPLETGNPIIDAINETKGYRINVGAEPSALVDEAIRITGVDPSWAPYLMIIMQKESSGNPVAYNPKSGATGIMQVKPGTFRSNAMPGYGDIWNPLDNMIAAINRIKNAWGTPWNIPGVADGRPYKGY